jgi:hypothetical protein
VNEAELSNLRFQLEEKTTEYELLQENSTRMRNDLSKKADKWRREGSCESVFLNMSSCMIPLINGFI